MEQEIQLSVKNLTGFLLHSGSIDNRFGGKDRAAEGTRIHRMLQKQAGPGYQAEVFFSLETRRGETVFLVQGRADGLFTDQEGTWIDEIKTTGYPLALVEEDFDRSHWGQAMCYAHFCCVQKKLDKIGVRLTYFQVETGEIKRFHRRYTAGELSAFYDDLLAQYQIWADFQRSWSEQRNQSLRALSFPFPQYRRGQRELAVAVYRTIERGGRLFCQAPTGIGKTISTLFPALKAMGEGMGAKIFYLTAKTITRQAAEDAFARLREQGLCLKTVTLTAKDKICFLEERSCNPEQCPYAKGYYDRVNDALYRLLLKEDALTRPLLEEYAREYTLCPFELSLDLTLWCDGIVCDYNYLFDPVVNLKRMFADEGGDFTFLIDEAHNLVERSREMYSARLSQKEVLLVQKKCREERLLSSALGELNEALLEQGKRCGEEDHLVDPALPGGLSAAASRFILQCDQWMEENREHPLHGEVLNLYFEVVFFNRIAELYDSHYVTCIFGGEQGLRAELLCLDTSAFLDGSMKRGRAAVLFSATLSPLDYYREVLGGGEEAHKCRLDSPFPRENLRLLVADRISTKYARREESYQPIADMLYTLLSGRQGNYLAYFPSYQYLAEVAERFSQCYPQVEVLIQNSGMSEGEREAFLARFDRQDGKSLLGFCVLGGIYSEGVDLQGDRLIGTAVIGVGLPQLNLTTNILKQYYDEKNGSGFAFAYRYPGMNKVLQAAGRVIRGMSDRGVVLLIDSRFSTGDYLRLFPTHWQDFRRVRSSEELRRQLGEFWDGGVR